MAIAVLAAPARPAPLGMSDDITYEVDVAFGVEEPTTSTGAPLNVAADVDMFVLQAGSRASEVPPVLCDVYGICTAKCREADEVLQDNLVCEITPGVVLCASDSCVFQCDYDVNGK